MRRVMRRGVPLNTSLNLVVSFASLNVKYLLVTEDDRSLIQWKRALEICVFHLVQLTVIDSTDNYSLSRCFSARARFFLLSILYVFNV